jgi:hypothetical protein
VLGQTKSQKSIKSYDQDIGLVLGFGISADLFQSPMLRPQNVHSLYPLASDHEVVEFDSESDTLVIIDSSLPNLASVVQEMVAREWNVVVLARHEDKA